MDMDADKKMIVTDEIKKFRHTYQVSIHNAQINPLARFTLGRKYRLPFSYAMVLIKVLLIDAGHLWHMELFVYGQVTIVSIDDPLER